MKAGAYTPTTPYVLNAESELSEDYHLVQNLPIDPNQDTVMACSRYAAQVEAVVLQKGVVMYYFPDPLQTGGWASYALPDATGVTAMVAGISGPVLLSDPNSSDAVYSDPTLKVFYTKAADKETLQVATITPPTKAEDAPSTTVETTAWSSKASELQLSVNWDGSLLVAAMEQRYDPKNPNTGSRLYFWTDGQSVDHVAGAPTKVSSGTLTDFPYLVRENDFLEVGGMMTPRWSAVVARPFALSTKKGNGTATINRPNLMLFTPADTFVGTDKPVPPSIGVWAWPVTAGTNITGTFVNWAAQADRPSACPNGTHEALAIIHATTLGGHNTPTLIVRTLQQDSDGSDSQHLWVVSHDPSEALSYPASSPDKAWSWTELQLPAVPSKDAPMSFTAGQRPLPDTEKPDDNVMPQTMLDVFVVTSAALHVIRQSSSGNAYTDYTHPIYCPAITLQPDVALAASQSGPSDGNELLVVGADGTLQTLLKDPVSGLWSDRPLHLPSSEIQQVSTYRTQITVTDQYGYLQAATPLTLSSASSVTALINDQAVALGPAGTQLQTDDAGQVTFAVVADGLSSPALTAKISDGPSLTIWPSSGINSYFQGGPPLNYLDPLSTDSLKDARKPDGTTPLLPGAQDTKQAGDAITTMTLAAKQATTAQVAAHRRRTNRSPHDGALRVQTPRGHVVTSTNIIKDIDAWGHDALHAIKKGAAKVKEVAYDAEKGVFLLTADFAGWVENVVSVVVTDVEKAAHVLHALINKLGGYILEAVKWLEAEVVGTFKDAFKLASEIETWLRPDGIITYLADQIAGAKGTADAWLTREKDGMTRDFEQWMNARSSNQQSTMGSLASRAAPLGNPRRDRLIMDSDAGASTKHHGLWLWNFSRWQLGHFDKPTTGAIDWAQIRPVQTAMQDALAQQAGDLVHAFEGLVGFWRSAIKDPKHLVELSENALLGALKGLIDWLFDIAHRTVDVFLDLAETVVKSFDAMLFTDPAIPFPGLKQLLALVGINEPTLGRVLLCVIAFPAVVTYKVKHKGHSYPFAPPDPGNRISLTGDADDAINSTAAGISFLWAAIDAVSSLFTATKAEPPRFIAALDIMIPLVLTVLTTPSTEGKRPFTPPPFDAKHQFGYLAWALGIADAVIAATDFFAETKPDKATAAGPGGELSLTDTLLHYETALGGVTLLLSCLQAHQDDDDGFEYADAVFDCLPLLAAPLLLDKYLLDSDGVTAGVDAAVVAGAGIVSGILYANESGR